MKITKSQLKRIIKEEIEKMFSEEYAPEASGRTVARIANELTAAGFGNPAGAQDVAKAIDAAVIAGVSDEETLKQKALNVGGLGSADVVAQIDRLVQKASRLGAGENDISTTATDRPLSRKEKFLKSVGGRSYGKPGGSW